jgi:hypothetical protein
VRAKDGGVGRISSLRTIEVPGHEKPGQALEGDVLDAVAIVVPAAVDDRGEGTFLRRRYETSAPQYALPDAGGPELPLGGRGIATGEFGELVAGRGLAQVVALAKLGFSARSLLGRSPAREADKKNGGAQSKEAEEQAHWVHGDSLLAP